MLTRKYRITHSVDFDHLFQKGDLRNNPLFYLKFASNNLTYSRFGFVVGVKLFKKAVKRNRVKRLMREVIRLNLAKIRDGRDMIIGAKSSQLYGMKYREMERLLLSFLANNNFLK